MTYFSLSLKSFVIIYQTFVGVTMSHVKGIFECITSPKILVRFDVRHGRTYSN